MERILPVAALVAVGALITTSGCAWTAVWASAWSLDPHRGLLGAGARSALAAVGGGGGSVLAGLVAVGLAIAWWRRGTPA